ncbi:MAG: hypothetical protein E6I84_04165 [Chloroflexi bacterium]|nr:MAG: hypothetical protein E6I84_04165 [Chloroflexota bacterium]
MFTRITGAASVPDDPWLQLKAAIEAVFRSWNSDRARAYRSREGIADDLGTAVTVQAMVFGNLGADSATGVLFTRNPATGEPGLYGDVMFAAQGEDVVAGAHRTEALDALETRLPQAGVELRQAASALERHLTDLCDIEFTVEEGNLWLLQVRVGKRSPTRLSSDPRPGGRAGCGPPHPAPEAGGWARLGYASPGDRPACLAGPGHRAHRHHARGRGGLSAGGPAGDPGALGDLTRGRAGNGSSSRRPYQPRRPGKPRRGGCARLGNPRGGRRGLGPGRRTRS